MSALRPAPDFTAAADPADLWTAGDAYSTPLADYLAAKVGQGFQYSTTGMVLEGAEVAAAEMAANPWASVYAGRPPPPPRASSAPTLSREDWQASAYHREGIDWSPSMTEAKARAMAEIHDRRALRQWLIDHREPGILTGALGFGAMMVGGLPAVENFIPVIGMATRAALAVRFGVIGGRAIAGAAENALVTAAIEPFIAIHGSQFGDDMTLAEALLDIGVGAALGGVLGGAGGLYHKYRGEPLAHRPTTVGAAEGVLNRAMDTLATDGQVDITPGLLDAVARDAAILNEPGATGRSEIFRDVREQLRAAGVAGDQADANAAVAQAWFDNVAAADGSDPRDLYREAGLEIRRGEVPGGPRPEAGSGTGVAAGDAPRGEIVSLDPDEIRVDAELFQFKAGGDEAGVSERLQGVERWDPYLAGSVMVWEARDGTRFIADGHQRLGLAKRLKAAGGEGSENIRINAMILREADGISDTDAMIIAAAKNISEGTGSAIDAAKVFRLAGEDHAALKNLPPRSALVRDGRALARLGPDAFGMVVNGLVPVHFAAIVARLIEGDPLLQVEALRLLIRASPENARQAELIVRELVSTGAERGTQQTLFGDEAFASSIVVERAQVLDTALKQVKRDKAAFAMLVKEGERLAEAGNVLADAANRERLTADEQALELLTRLATRAGPVSDALSDAARAYRSGEVGRGEAARRFLGDVRRADLTQLARGAGDGGDQPRDAGAADRPAPAAEEDVAPGPDPNQRALFQGEPVARLTGRELGDFGDDIKALRAAARDYYANTLRGTSVENPALGTVEFRGAGKAFSTSANPTKLKLFPALPEIVRRGELRRSLPNRDRVRHRNVAAYHWIEATVEIEGRSERVGVTIREDNNGRLYYNHNPIEQEGTPRPVGQTDPTSKKVGGGPPGDEGTLLQANIVPDDDLNITLLGRPGEESPRAAVELGDGIARITLGARADASTFMHEFAHVTLDLLRRLATREGAAERGNGQLARDWAVIRDWLGAEEGTPLSRDQHERYATAWERYLAEGRAPSIELEGVFARFRQWMLEIYRSLKNIGAEISPEVRDVFDRMLASEEQIAAARRADPGRDAGAPPGTSSGAGSAPAGPPPGPAPRGEASVAELAAEHGVDLDGSHDAELDLEIVAQRGLLAEETRELEAADVLVARAAIYDQAYRAAAACLGGRP